MAPVELDSSIRYEPLAVATIHVVAAVCLTSTVGRSLYLSYLGLSPAQEVRDRAARRHRLLPVFAALSALALGLATYSAFTYASLSYRVWADERGIQGPDRWFGGTKPTSSFGGTNVTQVFLSRWLLDTPVYQDAAEILSEKSRRFWWGQQIELSLVSWSLMLAIEGARRRIPYLFAYLSLAHLVNLSFAQNLFYVALLLTPAPLPESASNGGRLNRIRDVILPPKPANWCPKPGLCLVAGIINYGAIFLLPYAAGTASFGTVLGLSRAMTFAPLLLHYMAPVSWGNVHVHPHKAYGPFTDLFRMASVLSSLLHGKATTLSLFYNKPDARYHRHSRLLPWYIEKRTKWEQVSTAAGRVFGSTADHPVVAAVGRDVMLCTLSLGLWAAVRAFDADAILESTVPMYKGKTGALLHQVVGTRHLSGESAETSSPKRGHRATRSTASNATSDDSPAPKSMRKRGRPKKSVVEANADGADETYQPTAAEELNAVEGDAMPEEKMDFECAALSWGLVAFGGLGCGSAGVFGAECMSR